MEDKIKIVEDYVKGLGQGEIAHDFKHVHRVRNRALKIAKLENHEDFLAVELAALMHDIGLKNTLKRNEHGAVGAEMAREFMRQNNLIDEEKVELICEAIKLHNTIEKSENPLVGILRDADILDLMGAVGILRGLMYMHDLPDYLPEKIRGEHWGETNEHFTKLIKSGQRPADNVIDHLNFTLSCYYNITTDTAKKLARPLIEYEKGFILRVEKEILGE